MVVPDAVAARLERCPKELYERSRFTPERMPEVWLAQKEVVVKQSFDNCADFLNPTANGITKYTHKNDSE